MKNERIGIYNGIIKSGKDKIFKYASNAFHGNYGGIIINPKSNSIIGIHININKNEYKNNYLNIINVLAGNSFGYTQSTFSANFISKTLKINNSEIYFDIWDTFRWAEHLDGLVKIYLKGSKGILLLFSLIYEKSFL